MSNYIGDRLCDRSAAHVTNAVTGVTPHWAARYIGLGWDRLGEGPAAFNCWSFVRHVLAEQFGVAVPVIPYPDSEEVLDVLFDRHPEAARWPRVGRPQEGDLTLLRFGRDPSHVGIWVDADGGKVLHCARTCGVVCQTRRALDLLGGRIVSYHRFAGAAAS